MPEARPRPAAQSLPANARPALLTRTDHGSDAALVPLPPDQARRDARHAVKPGPPQDHQVGLAIRLSENLVARRSVSSGSSVWLSDGGGLTLFSPVDLSGLTGFCRVARRRRGSPA